MSAIPSGTVTFLFTDIQGSTRLWQDDAEAMDQALERHDEILRRSITEYHGHVFKTVGDAFCSAFAEPVDAVSAALSAQLVISQEHWNTPRPISVRMSIHTGAARERDNDYFGPPVNRVARIESLAHGGQIIMSRASAELVRDALPEGVQLSDKGAHRLKDLARPEEIFQIIHPDLQADFPPLRSMDVLPNNLPVQTTPLIGREKELAEVHDLFRNPDCRLVSLVGPGGMGKTRLSLQLAADMIDGNRDGTWFVDLSTVTQPSGVALETAKVLSIPQKVDLDPAETIGESLADKKILIVLDNFEQVMSAFPIVVKWLQAGPGVRLLVTSREPLRVRGEYVYHVPPLSLPAAGRRGTLSQFEATRLFIDRACASKPDFRIDNDNAPVVAEICSRLDGVPLAIELAAARIRLLSPAAILKRLGARLKLLTGGPKDMPDRHQTLRACIEWSYDLLSLEERLVYRAVSVFNGGISLAAAAAVILDESVDEMEILDGLQSLVEKSLIFRRDPLNDEPFFGILETIGEYGRERLIDAEQEDFYLDRHAAYFYKLVSEAETAWNGPEQKSWINRIRFNEENIRHAMNRLVDTQEKSAVILMTQAMVPYWIMRGQFSICREWLMTSLDQCSDLECADAAWLTLQTGWLSWASGDYTESARYIAKATEQFLTLDDRHGLAHAYFQMAYVEFLQGDFDLSLSTCQASSREAEGLDDDNLLANIQQLMGNIQYRLTEYEAAKTHYLTAQGFYNSAGNHRRCAEINNNIGALYLSQNKLDEAMNELELAEARLLDQEHYHFLRFAWCNLGEVHLAKAEYSKALSNFEKVKNYSVHTLDLRYASFAFSGIAESYIGLGDVEMAEHCALEAAERVEEYGLSSELAVALRVLGDIYRMKGFPAKAQSFYERALENTRAYKEIEEESKVLKGLEMLHAEGENL